MENWEEILKRRRAAEEAERAMHSMVSQKPQYTSEQRRANGKARARELLRENPLIDQLNARRELETIARSEWQGGTVEEHYGTFERTYSRWVPGNGDHSSFSSTTEYFGYSLNFPHPILGNKYKTYHPTARENWLSDYDLKSELRRIDGYVGQGYTYLRIYTSKGPDINGVRIESGETYQDLVDGEIQEVSRRIGNSHDVLLNNAGSRKSFEEFRDDFLYALARECEERRNTGTRGFELARKKAEEVRSFKPKNSERGPFGLFR